MTSVTDVPGISDLERGSEPSTAWQDLFTEARGNHNLVAGGLVLLVMVAIGLAGVVALPDPNQQDLTGIYLSPGTDGHILGTDGLGRDIFAWVSAGVWISLFIALTVVVISAVIGVSIGLCAGYVGGFLDALLMRLVDLQLAVPALLLFIAASVVLRPTMQTLILLLAAVGWVPYARLIRNVVLVERERGYIAAARLAGATRRRILLTHLLPAVSTTVLVLSSLEMGYVLLWESGLSFLGLGVRPPHNSLGFLINEGRSTLADAPSVVVFPGVAVAMLVLAFNLIGDGLRDVVHRDVEVVDR